MDRSVQLLADAIALADTGVFRNAAAMREALLLISDPDLVDWLIGEDDARDCLDSRCARAATRIRH
jgi:hypothetical protein